MEKKPKDIIIEIAAVIIAALISTAFIVIGIGVAGLLIGGFNSICAFIGISAWTIIKFAFVAFFVVFIWASI